MKTFEASPTDSELAEMEARALAATAEVEHNGWDQVVGTAEAAVGFVAECARDEDALLLAHARRDILRLVREVRRRWDAHRGQTKHERSDQ